MPAPERLTFRFREAAKASEFADQMKAITERLIVPEVEGKQVSVNIPRGYRDAIEKAAQDLGGYIPTKPTRF